MVVLPDGDPIGIPEIVTVVGTEVTILGVTVYPLAFVREYELAEPKAVTLYDTLYVAGHPEKL